MPASVTGPSEISFLCSSNARSARCWTSLPTDEVDQIAGYAKCSVPRYQRNVITLRAGTNDFIQEVIPTARPGLQPRIDAFNAKLPGIVSDLRADGKHVVLADASDVKVSDGLQNDAHPNDAGYARLPVSSTAPGASCAWPTSTATARPAGASPNTGTSSTRPDTLATRWRSATSAAAAWPTTPSSTAADPSGLGSTGAATCSAPPDEPSRPVPGACACQVPAGAVLPSLPRRTPTTGERARRGHVP